MLRFVGSRRLRRFASLSLGRLARQFSRAKRESAEEAIRGAFGDSLGAKEREPILLGSMTGVWTELFALAAAGSARADSEPSEIIGLERLQSSLAQGRGAILWESNGFGRRWIWKRVLKEQGYTVVQIHGPLNLGGLSLAGPSLSRFGEGWLRPLVYRWEGYFVGGVIQLARESSLEPLKQMRRRLRDNQIVCVSADGELGDRRLDVDLLGRKASLATGLTTLARNSKAPIHPVFCVPQAGGGCQVLIEDSIDPGLTGDRVIDAERALSRFAALLDSQVRDRPSLYRNWHQIARHPRIP